MKVHAGVIGLVVVVVGVVAVLGGERGRGAAEPVLASVSKRLPQAVTMGTAARMPWVSSAPLPSPSLPGSLRGTTPDGSLSVDAAGHLLADVGLRRFFDYFLSATGEEATGTLRLRILQALTARLHSPALEEGRQWLDRYLAYREAARTVAPTMNASVLERLTQLTALREKYLGEGAQTLFADEETLAARVARVEAGPAEREAMLRTVEAGLPEAQQRAHAAMMAPVSALQAEVALRKSGGSEADVQRLREETLGGAAAGRLAALDREQAEWRARLDAFEQRDAAENGARAPEEHGLRRAELRDSLFSPAESLRVQALERAGKQRP